MLILAGFFPTCGSSKGLAMMTAEHEQGRKSLGVWPAGIRAGAASEGWKSDLEGMDEYIQPMSATQWGKPRI